MGSPVPLELPIYLDAHATTPTDPRVLEKMLPYLQDEYGKKLKEQEILRAQEKAKKDEKRDLAIYLEEGLQYLRNKDFERAEEAFGSAVAISPRNDTASRGLRAAELKISDISKLPSEADPDADKKKRVIALFQQAMTAFANRSYQDAIRNAEEIRKIELTGDTQYLSEAKKVIDRALVLQIEEF